MPITHDAAEIKPERFLLPKTAFIPAESERHILQQIRLIRGGINIAAITIIA